MRSVQEALRETGKAVDEDKEPVLYAAIDPDGPLAWYNRDSNKFVAWVALDAIFKYDFKPYHPQKEIVPTEAEEFWKNSDGTCAHTSDGMDCVWLSKDADRPIRLPANFLGIIHGKNGWTRIFPQVEGDKEKVVIKDVTWFETSSGVIAPTRETEEYDWDSLVGKNTTIAITYDKD